MKDLIDILIKMGAEKVEYKQENHDNDLLTFKFRDKHVEIMGCWHQDGTGGITSNVRSKSKEEEPRPNFTKQAIVRIGTIIDGNPVNWIFNEKYQANSVGYYISPDWELFSGYTIDELREISNEL